MLKPRDLTRRDAPDTGRRVASFLAQSDLLRRRLEGAFSTEPARQAAVPAESADHAD
ncbi:hypothetical protein [Micromonospora psammae]|uniref:hypothetical protein n=1 Tax=Micromonospora sp. CPCC 205556 TaxID=3122398 RepID=UPI002FF27838